jgi:hypothetical protein
MSFIHRLAGAMRLDPGAYEAVEADPRALGQAFAIVVVFALAAGIGLAGPERSVSALGFAVAGALVGWLSWAALVCYLGRRVFAEPQTRADVGELARPVGYSAAPGVLLVLLAVPVLRPASWVIAAAVAVWMGAAMVVAIKQALDFTHASRAIAVCVAGLVLAMVFVLGLGTAFGPQVR